MALGPVESEAPLAAALQLTFDGGAAMVVVAALDIVLGAHELLDAVSLAGDPRIMPVLRSPALVGRRGFIGIEAFVPSAKPGRSLPPGIGPATPLRVALSSMICANFMKLWLLARC